jgi:hypothetical protein
VGHCVGSFSLSATLSVASMALIGCGGCVQSGSAVSDLEHEEVLQDFDVRAPELGVRSGNCLSRNTTSKTRMWS